jgi:hypothetical protein
MPLPNDACSPAPAAAKFSKTGRLNFVWAEPIVSAEEKMRLVFCATRWHISAVR